MNKLFLSFVLLFTLAAAPAFSQITVTGKIVDSLTREPLPGASVFAQNTTQGTTSTKEGEFSLTLKSGGYDLIFSFTGYEHKTVAITDNKNITIEIALLKQDKAMDEVVIQSSNEVMDGWEKYGDFFISQFIGATPFAANCTIMNKDVVRFFYYRRTDKLKVLATEPLVINNEALGYDLQYKLDSFVYHYKTNISSYRGTCFYTEKLGTVSQAMIWKANREKAYAGSRMHFMRSVYDSTVKESGFNISLLDEADKTRFLFLLKPLDHKYYQVLDSLDEVELFYPQKASITYTKAVPENSYLEQFKLPKDVGVQVSYVDVLQPLYIKQNGYYYEQNNWINQGYWSWKNIADQLPYDYLP